MRIEVSVRHPSGISVETCISDSPDEKMTIGNIIH